MARLSRIATETVLNAAARDEPTETTAVIDKTVWIVVAGGGTIGHLNPGLAAAEALVDLGLHRDQVHFVGSRRGVEAARLPATGFGLTLLPGRGIQRKLSIQNIGALWGLLGAFIQAFVLVRRLRPAVVLATGGYASAPCALAAWLLRIPLVVAEQNAIPGLVNRLAAKVAKAAAVSFADTPLPRAELVGNPVRAEMLAVDRVRDRNQARVALGIDTDRVLVVVFGGSLGARRINEAALGARKRWADRADLAIYHVIGDRDWSRHQAELATPLPADGLLYRAVRFEADMPSVLAAADVAVCRAGATTIAELAVVGVPSVLVPLPIATADHQSANARALVAVGAAVSVPDAEFDTDRLVGEVEAMIADPAVLAARSRAATRLARPDAAEQLAAMVVRHSARTLASQEGSR